MDTKKKLIQLEDEHVSTQHKIENDIEAIQDEKRELRRYLDNIASKLNHNTDKYEDFTTDKSSVYRVLQDIQTEGDILVRTASNKLENQLQENQANYQKQVLKLEEELQQQKEDDQS